jgi:hypothetical protein
MIYKYGDYIKLHGKMYKFLYYSFDKKHIFIEWTYRKYDMINNLDYKVVNNDT